MAKWKAFEESEIFKMKILLDELSCAYDYDHNKIEKHFMDMVNQALEAYRVSTIFNNTYMNTKTVDISDEFTELTIQS